VGEASLEEGVLRADAGDCARGVPLLEAALTRRLSSERRAAARARLDGCRADR
jgi:hypothetical protein